MMALVSSVAAAAGGSFATARGFAAAAGFATADRGAASVLGGPTSLNASEDAVLLAGRAAVVGTAARGFATAAGFAAARGSSATARRFGGATAARLSSTAAAGFATADRSTAVLGGQFGLQAGEDAALLRRTTWVATRRLAAAGRLGVAAAWLGSATAAAHAPGMSVGSESQRHSDAQRRQQVTFHREAPEYWWGRYSRASALSVASRSRPVSEEWRRMRFKRVAGRVTRQRLT